MRNVMLIFVLSLSVDGLRILGLFPTPIKSHYMFYKTIMIELARKGHDVHVLTHFPIKRDIERFNQLSVAGSINTLENNISLSNYDYPTFLDVAQNLFTLGNNVCAAILKHPVANQIKSTKIKYDLIVSEVFATDCLLPYAYIHNTPIIGVSSTSLMPWGDERMGNPDNPSYIPSYFIASSSRMDFIEKLQATMVNIISKFWYYVMSTIPAEIRGRELFENVPTLDNIAKNTSVLLVNTHFSINEPRPLVPGVVEIGGLHISHAKPLPADLLEFMSSANDGVIYFNMGTLIDMRTFEKLHTFLDVLSGLPQKVIIKASPYDLHGVVSDVYVAPWLPQLDILCHPKTKLFVTHGGTLSMQEAAHCGVPILGIPFNPNEELNIRNFVDKSAGLLLHYRDIKKDELKTTFATLLKPIYATNALALSKLFNDRLIKPMDLAIYWVEYIGRNGGRHLRTRGADMIFFEYFLVDVIIVAAVLFMILAVIFFNLLNFLQNFFDHPPPSKN